jgi:predicted aspartyl protease
MIDPEFVFEYCRYPIIPVRFINKDKKTPFIDALLDSGGDFIVIPMPIAQYLDLKLKKAGHVDTAGGKATLFKSKITMTIGDKEDMAIYKDSEIHISARDDIPILLGRQPLFEDYEITFKKHKNKIILKPVKN